MASDVSRGEFHHLEARVTVVEQEVEGEKMVTRHILEQSRRNGADLVAVKDDLVAVKGDLADFKKQTGERFDRLERKVDSLRRDIPSIVGEVMRDVLRERDQDR